MWRYRVAHQKKKKVLMAHGLARVGRNTGEVQVYSIQRSVVFGPVFCLLDVTGAENKIYIVLCLMCTFKEVVCTLV